MMDETQAIRKNYHKLIDSCPLNTMDVWKIQDEISDILYEKGYDLINFCNAPCQHGHFNAIDCYSKIAPKLAEEIRKNGFEVFLIKNPNKRSISWIIFPFNLVVEIRDVVENFEVIK